MLPVGEQQVCDEVKGRATRPPPTTFGLRRRPCRRAAAQRGRRRPLGCAAPRRDFYSSATKASGGPRAAAPPTFGLRGRPVGCAAGPKVSVPDLWVAPPTFGLRGPHLWDATPAPRCGEKRFRRDSERRPARGRAAGRFWARGGAPRPARSPVARRRVQGGRRFVVLVSPILARANTLGANTSQRAGQRV